MSGLGRMYKRNEVWWIDYSFRGKRRRESSGSTLKGDATKLLRKRTAEMGKGRIIGPDQERLTFEDLSEIIVRSHPQITLESLESEGCGEKRVWAGMGEGRIGMRGGQKA